MQELCVQKIQGTTQDERELNVIGRYEANDAVECIEKITKNLKTRSPVNSAGNHLYVNQW